MLGWTILAALRTFGLNVVFSLWNQLHILDAVQCLRLPTSRCWFLASLMAKLRPQIIVCSMIGWTTLALNRTTGVDLCFLWQSNCTFWICVAFGLTNFFDGIDHIRSYRNRLLYQLKVTTSTKCNSSNLFFSLYWKHDCFTVPVI